MSERADVPGKMSGKQKSYMCMGEDVWGADVRGRRPEGKFPAIVYRGTAARSIVLLTTPPCTKTTSTVIDSAMATQPTRRAGVGSPHFRVIGQWAELLGTLERQHFGDE